MTKYFSGIARPNIGSQTQPGWIESDVSPGYFEVNVASKSLGMLQDECFMRA
jgi:hypothetical protein